jgi:hypothetical protein
LLRVIEHGDEPRAGLQEVAGAAGGVLLSTPREPLWRLLNLTRGKYLRDLGNTPGHLQHFGRRELVPLAQTVLDVRAVRSPVPRAVVYRVPR